MKLSLFTLALLFPLSVAAQGTPGSHFMDNWDLDSDGTVTLAELTQRRGDVFYMFDTDENGLLDASEYAAFDDARTADMAGQGDHANGRTGRVQQGMVLAFNDINADGQVSEAEFLAKADDWLGLIDRNGSGDITAADFAPRG